MYHVRGSTLEKPMKFKLCDTRGLDESQGIDAQELNYLLDGNIPNGYQVITVYLSCFANIYHDKCNYLRLQNILFKDLVLVKLIK